MKNEEEIVAEAAIAGGLTFAYITFSCLGLVLNGVILMAMYFFSSLRNPPNVFVGKRKFLKFLVQHLSAKKLKQFTSSVTSLVFLYLKAMSERLVRSPMLS